ncbi:potassium channel subfamily K member 1-like isoform X2 [Lineus longissimus]|uniref:potassium channel subfamily K member 1-like isoform X2 n=1 Tax=Lineus longissimus TaxID=88925 RepID=UPI00315CE44D
MSEDYATCWWCRRSTCRTLFLVAFIVCYILLGAYIFQLIEKPIEDELRACVQDIRADFLKGHSQCMTDGELEAFIVEIVKASERGVSAIYNVSSEPNWSFGQSIFFAGTVLTTIGYGHTTPLSEGGKVLCIVYALIGVPLTLIMFTAVVERLMIPSTKFLKFLGKKMEHLHKAVYIRFLHLFIVFTILLLLVFIIPSVIFSTIEEEWNFLDSIYYCFISMTTIGLGDYIPGEQPNQKHRTVYKVFITIYLLLGLICMMFTLAVMYEIPELNLGLHFYMRSDEEDDEKQRLKDSINPGNNYTDLDKVAEGGSLNEGSPAREQPE